MNTLLISKVIQENASDINFNYTIGPLDFILICDGFSTVMNKVRNIHWELALVRSSEIEVEFLDWEPEQKIQMLSAEIIDIIHLF